jgi:uncharacterized membrane protein
MEDVVEARRWLAPKGRTEAFSDGVFAIAITLLVLELRPPEAAGEFAHDLLNEWPTYLAYVAAFVMIGSVWLHHHLVFTRVRHIDTGALLANLALLLTVSVLPFPTAVLSSAWRTGDSVDRVTAAVLFGLLSVAISAAYIGLCTYLSRRPELLVEPAATGFLRGERRRGATAIIGTVIATLVAFVAPLLTLILFAVTPAFYLMTVPRTSPVADADEGPERPT